MYADDTTVYCVGDSVDNAVTSLNVALSDLNRWYQVNSLTPHSGKREAMLLMKKNNNRASKLGEHWAGSNRVG